MKLLWNYLRPHRSLIALSLLLAGIAQILTLVDPIIFGKLIDEYALNKNNLTEDARVRGALYWLAIAIGVALAARFAKAVQDYISRLVVQKFGMQIFNDGLKQSLRLNYEEYEQQRSGETLSMLQKVRRDTEMFINQFINILFSSIVGVGFLMWYAVTKHWALIPIFVIGVIVLGGLTGLLSQKIKTLQRSIFRENAQMSGVITESLRNIELVKGIGLTYSEIRRLREHTQKIFDLEMAKTRKARTLSFIQSSVLSLLKQSILFILLWLIFRDILSPGELISMQSITNIIFVPLQDLGNLILAYREAEASVSNFDALMQKPVEHRPENPIEIGDLEKLTFRKVVFRHRNGTINAIDDISFEAKLGDTIAFVGPSGSGKSTLVKLLIGLYTPTSGEILYDDIPITQLRYNKARRQIGFVTQESQLFAGTLRHNLLFSKPDASDEEMFEAVRQASLDKLVTNSPQGLDTLLGEGGTRLSGGEKQRLSIARALIRKPKLLIFDEATSALDSITEESINETVKGISERREQIMLLIAHRLSTIMHADRIYVLERGRIVEEGSHDELLANKGLYFAMWRQQIGERKMNLRQELGIPDQQKGSRADADETPVITVQTDNLPRMIV